MKRVSCVLLIVGALVCACSGDNATPTAPSPGPGYDGQWSGTTSLGWPVTFTVSSNRVTAVSVGYRFGACSGSKIFSNVNVEIASGPGPGGQVTGFGLGEGAPDGSSAQVQGFFRSNTTADGIVVFAGYPGCGDGFGFWTGVRR